MSSGLVARAVHENERNGFTSVISFLYGTHFVLPSHSLKIQSSHADTCSIVQLFFFFTSNSGAGLRLLIEDHDKDESERCEDVVERDADGCATQKLWPPTHRYLTFNEVSQSITTKDKKNNNTARQFTVEPLDKLNMNVSWRTDEYSETGKLHENR